MKTFEECLARVEYQAECEKRARRGRRIRRSRTREERRLRKRTNIFQLSVLAWAAVMAFILATGTPRAPQEPQPPTHIEAPAESETTPVVEEEYDPEAFESERIEAALLARAHKIEDVLITHYCAERYPHICGTGDGKTASGRWLQPYVSCAVDPSVIPLGSTVMVDYGDGELHYYMADDVGAWIKGAHIDLAVTTHEEAESLGTKRATIYWAEEG